MVTVLIVDDHPLVRMGIRGYLETESDIKVVGEAADGAEALQMAKDLAPDVVLMDLFMPTLSGVDATLAIHAAGLPCQVVILTSSVDDEQVVSAIRAGALSYILKTSSPDKVAQSVRSAASGVSVLDPQAQRRLVGEVQGHAAPRPWEDLTERERDVLKAIAGGKNNQEIADSLGIGVKTVKTHVSNIFLKLGVMDRTQAAIYAIRHHLD